MNELNAQYIAHENTFNSEGIEVTTSQNHHINSFTRTVLRTALEKPSLKLNQISPPIFSPLFASEMQKNTRYIERIERQWYKSKYTSNNVTQLYAMGYKYTELPESS